jgi:hypothetical protein
MFSWLSIKKENLFLFFLLAVAAGLRIYQIQFGKPFLYHPDEIKLVAQAGRLLASKFLEIDVYFAIGIYPPFFTYLLTIPFALYIGFNLITGRIASPAEAKWLYELSPFNFFLLGRLLTAFLGVLSVYFFYRLIERLYNKRLAQIAAALLAVNFVHVQQSHYATVDLPASFFVLMTIWFAALLAEKPLLTYYVAAALFGAMAIATKFSMMFCLAPVVVAHVYAAQRNGLCWPQWLNKKIMIFLVTLLISFALFCPLFWLDYQKSHAGMVATGQFEKEGKLGSGGALFSYWTGDQSEGFGVFYPNDLPHTFGFVLMGFTLAGLIIQMSRRRYSDVLLLSFSLLTYLMFEYVAYKAIRHILPVVPFFMLAAAIAIEALCSAAFKRALRRHAAMWGIVLGLVVLQVAKTHSYFSKLAATDPRTTAREWILQNLPDRSRIKTELFPPTLPNVNDAKPGDVIGYDLSFFKMNSRQKNRTQQFTAALRDSMVDYYIADGFTRAFFEWKYSEKKYPELVQERKQFFNWLETHTQRIKTFDSRDPHIQPDIIVYKVRPLPAETAAGE